MTYGAVFDFFKFFFFSLGKEATNTLIIVAGSFLSVLAGSIISRISSREAIAASNKNAIYIMQRQEFNTAAAEFRAAFVDEYRFLNRECAYDRIGINIPDILSPATEKHERAFIVFKTILESEDQINIQKAWDDYTGKDYHLGKYTFKQYTTRDNLKDWGKIRQSALDNIKALLKFAEPKH